MKSENFFTDLFKKKKQIPNKGQKGSPYQTIIYKYNIGEIVKIINTDKIGEIIKHSYKFPNFNLQEPAILLYILDIDTEPYEENQLTTPTPEEIELYLTMKKYNL